MPMLSMKTKKPMKPMLEMLEITVEAGLSSPNHPASEPTSRPSHSIYRGGARVQRNDHAPAEEVAGNVGHQSNGGEGIGGGRQCGLSARICGEVGRHQLLVSAAALRTGRAHSRASGST